MTSKKFRMFAGPNGSGKSTLIKEISRNFHIGYFINEKRHDEVLLHQEVVPDWVVEYLLEKLNLS